MRIIKPIYLVLAITGLVLGVLLTVQFRVTKDITKNPQAYRVQPMVTKIDEARSERDQKQEKVNKMRSELDRITAGTELGVFRDELNVARIEAGLTALIGPGVEITMNDSNSPVQPGNNPNLYVLHDEDVLRVLNELRAAGAEALAINDQRVLATSEIRCVGPTILINRNQRLTPPFIITAIGNQDNMVNSLKMRDGVVDALQFWGIQISIKKVSQVNMPAYVGGVSFDFAGPAPEGQ